MSVAFIGFDSVCPTALELPDEERYELLLLPWAAHHRATRPFRRPYEEVLREEEQAYLLHQAGFSAAGNPYVVEVDS